MCPRPWSLCRVRPVFFAGVIKRRISAVVPPLVPSFSRSLFLLSFMFPLFILAQFMEYDARCDELEATEDYHLNNLRTND
jgi:hypothetical protein